MKEYSVTRSEAFAYGLDKVVVEYHDTSEAWRWRLVVNGTTGPWQGKYADLLIHEGYGVVTEYWSGDTKPRTPFKMNYCTTT